MNMILSFNILIPLMSPIIGAVTVGLFGRFLGRRGSIFIATSGLGIAFLAS